MKKSPRPLQRYRYLSGRRNDGLIDRFLRDVDYYKVTEDGKVWTRRPAKGSLPQDVNIESIPWREKHIKTKGGYQQVTYDTKNISVHRLVYRAFVGPLKGIEVSHIDGNNSNNHYKNLRLNTMSQISLRSLLEKPERMPSNVRTSREDLRTLWILRTRGLSLKQIAEVSGVSKSNLSYIFAKRSRIEESNEILAELAAIQERNGPLIPSPLSAAKPFS